MNIAKSDIYSINCLFGIIQQLLAHSSQAQRATVQQLIYAVQLKLKELSIKKHHEIGAILIILLNITI